MDLFGDRNATLSSDEGDKDKDENVLIWHKLDNAKGYQPSLREGHTSVAYGSKVIVFGGFETGKVT